MEEIKQISPLLSANKATRPKNKQKMDADNLKVMLQAAVNLELFTIPLYMYSMYSLTGVHQITGEKSKLYQGRWWPGIAPSFSENPKIYENLEKMPIDKSIWDVNNPNYVTKKLDTETNRIAFNLIFKVFIEEMFHLQLISNLSKSLGVEEPSYTHPDLVSQPDKTNGTERGKSYGWHCYQGTKIPYIVDLKDTKTDHIRVKLGSLDKNQIELFKVIEMPKDCAEKNIKDGEQHKYKLTIPFEKKYEQPSQLPMFGSIGNLYDCIKAYLDLEYDIKKGEDGKTLLDFMLKNAKTPYPQHDIFNNQRRGHPKAEYPGVNATVFGSDGDLTRDRIFNMINAITDQGEGNDSSKCSDFVTAVDKVDQSDVHALRVNHKTYTDEGTSFDPNRSSHAYARSEMKMEHGKFHGDNVGKMDHEEIFEKVEELMGNPDFQTWDTWHSREGNAWTADMLRSKDYEKNEYREKLPTPERVAQAMNNLKRDHQSWTTESEKSDPYDILSQASAGSIKGITTVLNKYWNSAGGSNVNFPSPSMGGSGDRLSICWALFGEGPNLKDGVLDRIKSNGGNPILNHTCQGLAIDPIGGEGTSGGNDCADTSIYHTCKGSNLCKAEGGCGFVQSVGSHSNCGGKAMSTSENEQPRTDSNGCGPSDKTFSPPGDNACGGQGGCAVPISASQLFPDIPPKGEASFAYMPLFDFEIKENKISAFPSRAEGSEGDQDKINYGKGDNVSNVAWNAVSTILKNRKNHVEIEKLEPNDLRVALPPST